MVGSTTWVLLEIYLAFQQWKNFENPLRIDKVIAMSSAGVQFFWPTLYICISFLLLFCSFFSRIFALSVYRHVWWINIILFIHFWRLVGFVFFLRRLCLIANVYWICNLSITLTNSFHRDHWMNKKQNHDKNNKSIRSANSAKAVALSPHSPCRIKCRRLSDKAAAASPLVSDK